MYFTDNENIKFDCNRGCTVSYGQDGTLNCNYRSGCCKLKDYNWMSGIRQEQYDNLFEVRFKNTHKGIYVNDSGQSVKTGDLVVVEAQSGHDLGIVTLEGPIVGRQMKCKGIDPELTPLRKIYRKAKSFDIEKWQEAIAREQETMIRARQIAVELNLEMKIGDVEFQGDGTKAIFYYIADGRVDFRQLIKVFAEEFHIRIEMKQIGARQEAGLIGGIGVCGRELCCANYITEFKSITTTAARCQNLSLNPQKLAGQCGKLKCCLNYEVATYMDAGSRIPKVVEPLEFEDGQAFLMKTDILREVMFFSYDKNSLSNLYELSADEVRNIIEQNRNGIKPESLKTEPEPERPEFVTAVGEDSVSRFDRTDKRRKGKGRRNGGSERNASGRQQGQNVKEKPSQQERQNAAPTDKLQGERNRDRQRPNGRRQRPRPDGGRGGDNSGRQTVQKEDRGKSEQQQ